VLAGVVIRSGFGRRRGGGRGLLGLGGL